MSYLIIIYHPIIGASDDIRSEDFIEKNLRFLENNKDYIGSISPTKFENRDYNTNKIGDKSISQDSLFSRLNHFLYTLNANARFYSLFRIKFLKNFPFKNETFFAEDFLLIIHILKYGKLKKINEGHLILGKKGISNSSNYLKLFFGEKKVFFYYKKFMIKSFQIYSDNNIIKLLIFIKTIYLNLLFNISLLKISIYTYFKKIFSDVNK